MTPGTTPDERWDSDVVLGDGETAHIRPIRPSDAPALAAFHRRQSAESIYRRFFSPKPELSDADLQHFTVVDFVDRVALVVERQVASGQPAAVPAGRRRPLGRGDLDGARHYHADPGFMAAGDHDPRRQCWRRSRPSPARG